MICGVCMWVRIGALVQSAHLALGIEVELAEHKPGEPPRDQPQRRAELERVNRAHALVLNPLP